MTLIAYWLTEEESGPIGAQLEWIEARKVRRGVYRLLESPVFAYGLSRGDVVAVTKERGAEWVDQVLEQSENWCARVVAKASAGVSEEAVIRELREAGLEVRATDFPMLVVDVPAETDPHPVLALLERGQREHRWFYDLGVDPLATE